jgi:hypothetical protein
MIEAIVLWNEPNNLTHWNYHLDPNRDRHAEMVKLGSQTMRCVDCDFAELECAY